MIALTGNRFFASTLKKLLREHLIPERKERTFDFIKTLTN